MASVCPGCGSRAFSRDDRGNMICDYCGHSVQPSPAVALAESMRRNRIVEPLTERLFRRYSSRVVAKRPDDAIKYLEAATYLSMWVSFPTPNLEELEEMATVALESAAEQLEINYVAPSERGAAVTWRVVQELAGRTIDPRSIASAGQSKKS
ncbi:MAG: TFIIB-type zinc ribbon-containing protein [Myxococcota bacterium]